MGLRFCPFFLLLCVASCWVLSCDAQATVPSSSFEESFEVTGPENHFKTSPDGQVWYLSLDEEEGCGFQSKQRYRFGSFSMKLKLVGGDSAGVVTAYYMCSDLGAGPERDELDFEFLGNVTGQPYVLQTNIYKSGVGGREMRHMLWFDPTADFHTYSILWNSHQIVFFADRVPIRVHKNNGQPNNSFPSEKPMYIFSSIWDGENWATMGGLEKTNWANAPFVSAYQEFSVDACEWGEQIPACASTTTDHWWDQSSTWVLDNNQQEDLSWLGRNLEVYNYCKDQERYPTPPEECNL